MNQEKLKQIREALISQFGYSGDGAERIISKDGRAKNGEILDILTAAYNLGVDDAEMDA